MKKQNKTLESSTLKSLFLAAMVIITLVGIIWVYYKMVYEEKRTNIIRSGEIAARQSAVLFDKYLSTNIDLINFTAYTLDEMIVENKSDEEIQNFLVGQSTAIRNAVVENSTGLYGYINGRFFSGTNWIPPEDYEATERPWYIKPRENGRNITILEPYHDMQSGNTMLALGKTLCDGVGVISVDISLDQIQKLTEQAVQSSETDIAMILTDKGVVVTHSDTDELGKEYGGAENSFGAFLFQKINHMGDNYFEFSYGDSQYIVYAADILDEWYSIAIKDVTQVFNHLRLMLIGTIILVIGIVAVISMIVVGTGKRNMIADRLNVRLTSAVDIYRSAYDLDILNDTYYEILTGDHKISNILQGDQKGAQQEIRSVMEKDIAEESKAEAIKFVDFSTLNDRLKDRHMISLEFLSKENIWLRGRFIVSERTGAGIISHVLWVVEDIDEERRHRDSLIDLSERAVAASEAKSTFLSNMSHEIRTPINAILGMDEMILREYTDPALRSYALNIKSAGHTLLGIVNNILDFSKIEAGKMELITAEYDLSDMLCILVDMTRGRAEEKGLALVTDFDRDIPKMLEGDEPRLRQVIANLLSNAVKYTEKGSIFFSVGFEKLTEEPDYILLKVCVKDTGIGIKEEDFSKLYAEFERFDMQRNRNIEGTGLGISITRNLLDMMESSLEVQSIYGFGSMFSFSVKQRVTGWNKIGEIGNTQEKNFEKNKESEKESKIENKTEKKPENKTENNSETESGKNSEKKACVIDADIMAVDDNYMNLAVFKSLLKRTGVRIDEVMSGEEALKLTREKKYDVIFMDHMMPEMDGIETLHEIRSREEDKNHETPVICVTANAIAGAREHYLDEGFDDYLSKPISGEMLEKMLISFLPSDKVGEILDSFANNTEDEADFANDPEIKRVREAFAGSELINIAEGIKNSGSAEAYMPLLKIFYTSLDESSALIDGFSKNGDFKNYTIKVHAIKSSARIIGASALGETAQRLEEAGKKADGEYIAAHHEEFIRQYRSFKPLLEKLFVAEEGSDKPEAGEELIRKAYEDMATAAMDMDCEALEAIFVRMQEYSIPEKDREIWKKLRNASEQYDYDGVLRILESIE